MSIINRPDLVEKARSAFGIVQGQVGGTLSDELVPVVIIDDVSGADVVSTQHPLNALGDSTSAAGGATFFSKVGLQNPVGSGVDVFVQRVYLSGDVIQLLTLRRGVIAASPNAGVRDWLDRRAPGNPAGIVWDENGTVTLGTQILEMRILARTPYVIDLGMTMAPGDSVHVQPTAANVALGETAFWWSERVRRR